LHATVTWTKRGATLLTGWTETATATAALSGGTPSSLADTHNSTTGAGSRQYSVSRRPTHSSPV